MMFEGFFKPMNLSQVVRSLALVNSSRVVRVGQVTFMVYIFLVDQVVFVIYFVEFWPGCLSQVVQLVVLITFVSCSFWTVC